MATDLIPTNEAARLKLSPRGTTRTATIIRLVQAGKVAGKKVGGFWFVSRASLLSYLAGKPAAPKPRPLRTWIADQKAAHRRLARFGIRLPPPTRPPDVPQEATA